MPSRMPRRLLLPGLAIATLLAGCATTTSPTGRTQYVGAVSQAQLDQMGAQAFAETKAKTPLDKDAKQNAYVRCVVDALVRELPSGSAQAWDVAVFVDKDPNAFALPGGKVGVYTGIFTVAKNQDQLAAVIGHEIGHVYARHTNERVSRQSATSTGLAVLGALAGARYGQTGSDLVTQGGGMAAQLGVLLPFSRTQESEADEIGQKLMAQAGFDPAQAAVLWENMIAASAGRSPEWLSTHPDPQNRIKALQARAPSLQPVYQAARQAGRTPRCGS